MTQSYATILVDTPDAHICRITLNRPEKRNALSNQLRSELFEALDTADNDSDVHVIIIRGAGKAFSAGYDLGEDNRQNQPWTTPRGEGAWARHVTEGWFRMWDMQKPIIAQVHGYCLAGGSELAAACDLVYVADDAQIGYPPVRLMSSPDMQYPAWLMGMRAAMEFMLTGDAISGEEAVRLGYANRAYPAAALEAEVLAIAGRVAKVPPDLNHLNKRTVHRAMEVMGIRTAMRAGHDIHALAWHQQSSKDYMKSFREAPKVSDALSERDKKFGDYREGEGKDKAGDS